MKDHATYVNSRVVIKDQNKKQLRCECPDTGNVPMEDEGMYSKEEKSGMNHKPNQCKRTNNIKKYRRGNKDLYLCSCCVMFGDKEIN